MTRSFIFAACTAMMCTSALSADPVTTNYYSDPEFNWEGFYAGLQVGGAFGTGDVDIPAYVPPDFSVGTAGAMVGAHVGYNMLLNDNMFAGIELGANYSFVSGSDPTGPGTEDYIIDQDWEASLVGRLGMISGNTAFYGLLGPSVTSLTAQYDPVAVGPKSDTVWGVTAGAGAEMAFSDMITGGIEYRYSLYQQASFVHNGPSTVDYDSHAIMLRLNLHAN